MNPNTKAILISIILFVLIFLIIFFSVRWIFNNTEGPLPGFIAAAIAAIFAPRRQIIYKQSGKEVQLTWFFSKKIFHL